MSSYYKERMDGVVGYMEKHFAQKITLDRLADISGFSKYHFSRIFSSITGSTPAVYLTRLRLREAVRLLVETDKTVLEISMLCGFESPSGFNSVFKRHFQKTPSEIRISSRADRNIPLLDRKMQDDESKQSSYAREVTTNFLRRIWDMNISIRQLADVEVAYVRHVGSYLDTYQAWDKLGTWAARNGIYAPEQQFIGISLDDPALVEEHACRYDACVTLPEGFDRTGHADEIRFVTLQGGTYALYSFYDSIDQLGIAYQTLFGQWLPQSGYEAEDKPCLEYCMNNPATDPEGKSKVDLFLPIKPRS
ncbi:AraC family transcriptional regulator [Paenibacillus sp. A14]|uniref:AraC family transcriptional regulator n=1 Tax=Paenibacillus sp. A14 TaxID=3119820 RepID=UPI002FE04A58